MPVSQTLPTLTAADRARYGGGFSTSAAAATEEKSKSPEIRIPLGGSLFWQWTSLDGEPQTAKSLNGRLVAVGPAEQTLWPTTTAGSRSRPLMILRPVGRDGKPNATAVRVGNDFGDLDINEIEAAAIGDGMYDSAQIKYFHRQGRALPRAKCTRRIAMLLAGSDSPVMVTLPQMSQEVLDAVIRNVMQQGAFPWQATIALHLKKGRTAGGGEYSCLDPVKCSVVSVDSVEKSMPFFEQFTASIEESLWRDLKPVAIEEPVPF